MLGKVYERIPIPQLIDPGVKFKNKPRYQLRKMILNQDQEKNQTEKWQKHFRVARN